MTETEATEHQAPKAETPQSKTLKAVFDRSNGWVLVGAQLIAMSAIILSGIDAWPWSNISWGVIGAGVVIGLVSLFSLAESFHIHPLPNQMGIRRDGIYRIIRHPMYLAVLLISVGICNDSKPLSWVFFGFLAFVLWLKMLIEEVALIHTYPEYRDYALKTKRLLPFIW